jgi:hypothetical protein
VIAEDVLPNDGYAANGGVIEGDQATVTTIEPQKRRGHHREPLGSGARALGLKG